MVIKNWQKIRDGGKVFRLCPNTFLPKMSPPKNLTPSKTSSNWDRANFSADASLNFLQPGGAASRLRLLWGSVYREFERGFTDLINSDSLDLWPKNHRDDPGNFLKKSEIGFEPLSGIVPGITQLAKLDGL